MENREREELEKAAWFNHLFQTEGKKGTDIFSVLHLIIIRASLLQKRKKLHIHLLLVVVLNCFAWSSRSLYSRKDTISISSGIY